MKSTNLELIIENLSRFWKCIIMPEQYFYSLADRKWRLFFNLSSCLQAVLKSNAVKTRMKQFNIRDSITHDRTITPERQRSKRHCPEMIILILSVRLSWVITIIKKFFCGIIGRHPKYASGATEMLIYRWLQDSNAVQHSVCICIATIWLCIM